MVLDPGDVVQFKSGGPQLVVECATASDYVICQWFDRYGHTKRQEFPTVLLKRVPR